MMTLPPLDSAVLPAGIRSRFVRDINGLRVHILEAGFEPRAGRCVAAAAWLSRDRLFLAQGDAGAGRSRLSRRRAGSARLWPHHRLERQLRRRSAAVPTAECVRDVLGLVAALGHRSVAAVVGHDFGASVAAWCALVRPDVFRSLALMSAPFDGPPDLPFAADGQPPRCRRARRSMRRWRRLPRPRKHYQWYYSTRPANADDVALQAGRARLPARLFPPQERRLEGEQAVSAWRRGAPRNWRRCRPTTSWTWPTTCRRRWRRRCRPPPRSPPADGCPTASWPSMPASTSATGSRAACNWYRSRTSGASRVGAAAVRRPHDRRAVDLHLGQERLGRLPAAGRVRAHAGQPPAPAWSAVICSTAPATGCSRSRRAKVGELLVEFLRTPA